MTRDQIIEARQALLNQLPVTGEILRGSLFERTVRHTSVLRLTHRNRKFEFSSLQRSQQRTRFRLRCHHLPNLMLARWLGVLMVRRIEEQGWKVADAASAAGLSV